MNERRKVKVIHLWNLKTGQHKYYGSVSEMFRCNKFEVGEQTVYNKLKANKVCALSTCIIFQGYLNAE